MEKKLSALIAVFNITDGMTANIATPAKMVVLPSSLPWMRHDDGKVPYAKLKRSQGHLGGMWRLSPPTPQPIQIQQKQEFGHGRSNGWYSSPVLGGNATACRLMALYTRWKNRSTRAMQPGKTILARHIARGGQPHNGKQVMTAEWGLAARC
ncbi:MAG: hypothetical protein U1F00_02380 [Rhodoferax sp.]